MSDKNLKLIKANVESFGGIDSTKPILLSFVDKKNITIASGDEGVGKTSWLTALLYALGQSFKVTEDNFINATDNKIKVEHEFEHNGQQYRVNATKSKFELAILQEVAGKKRYLPVPSPIETLKQLVGYVGVSPMGLKEKKGEEQVKYLRKALQVSDDVENQETKIKNDLKAASEYRTTANREYERLFKILSENPLYLAWEESEKKYAEKKTSESEKQKVATLEAKKNQYAEAEQKSKSIDEKIDILASDVHDMERQIQELANKIIAKENEAKELGKTKEIATEWLSNHANIKQEYEEAREAYLNIERYLVEQSQWEAVKKNKADMDAAQTEVQEADNRKDAIRKKLLDVAKTGLPNIEGLEIITEDSIDGKKAGVYLNDRNLAQLSESQIWGLFLRIWEINDVNFVFVENISSLGSHAIGILNELAAEGVGIFASQMVRGQNDLKITITDKI